MILPPATLGLLGGGQLGRYFVRAAREMGYAVWVLDPDPHSPAGQVATRHLCQPYEDAETLSALAGQCAVITCEFENIPRPALEWLEANVCLRPGLCALGVAQDRLEEKRFLAEIGVAVAPWRPVTAGGDGGEDTSGAPSFPAILKTARLGYDGKGQRPMDHMGDLAAAHAELGGVDCVLEERVQLERELSVVVARTADGRSEAFPVAENVHRDGILHLSRVPARVDEDLSGRAVAIAQLIADRLDYCGVLAVEFFLTMGGELLVNEIAPRPHNTGHYTLDACTVSQFEQQVRAICGLGLAPARLTTPVAMVNLLGDLWPADGRPDWSSVLETGRARLHLYGKSEARAGRKMGHLSVLGLPGEEDAMAPTSTAEGLWQELARAAGVST
ncbi:MULTISPECIES: 5-(carboxyamino)imidazole ribonucleotide synthase [unclassified Thioalkalivibrio]|uniref:5-(carboxyamino)imidazole ribonucleotide synthase n=1 Tax=unclassified Thioalkalivibrio TaxID=2621013 RepID=UPI00035EBB46|nr:MULTISPECIES: 5-(carboxyamino)imidazole ribonucleotide synthase [unclassified Thioalkalivibrio]